MSPLQQGNNNLRHVYKLLSFFCIEGVFVIGRMSISVVGSTTGSWRQNFPGSAGVYQSMHHTVWCMELVEDVDHNRLSSTPDSSNQPNELLKLLSPPDSQSVHKQALPVTRRYPQRIRKPVQWHTLMFIMEIEYGTYSLRRGAVLQMLSHKDYF